MLHEHFTSEQFCPNLPNTSQAELISYARPQSGTVADEKGRWGVLILPGGGYHMVAPTEGEPVALAFLGAGVQAFVLRYSVAPARYPAQLLEAAGAMAFLRDNREKYGITHFAVCGFSAGGHLAGCLANLWELPLLSRVLGRPSEDFRPDAAILSYPVITAAPPMGSSFPNLLGEGVAVSGSLGCLSLETSVTAKNPPAFLWATFRDDDVPTEHTLLYASALRRAGVPFELHIFPNGPHAMATATPQSARAPEFCSPHAANWMPLCFQWLEHEALAGRE